MWAVTVRAMTLTAVLPIMLVACTSTRHPGVTRSRTTATTGEGSRLASHASTVPATSATLPDQVTITLASFAPGGDDLGARDWSR